MKTGARWRRHSSGRLSSCGPGNTSESDKGVRRSAFFRRSLRVKLTSRLCFPGLCCVNMTFASHLAFVLEA